MSNFKELVRVGKDAVVRQTGNGKSVTSFSAAYDNGWGDKKQTVWLDCSLWGERGAKVAEYITKGSQVVVDGNLGTREHEGKTYLTLDVQDVKLVSNKGERQPRQQSEPAGGDFADEDLPF